MLIQCTKCHRTVITQKVVTFTSGPRKDTTRVPEQCWQQRECSVPPAVPEAKVQMATLPGYDPT
jgi:hypothetical protein